MSLLINLFIYLYLLTTWQDIPRVCSTSSRLNDWALYDNDNELNYHSQRLFKTYTKLHNAFRAQKKLGFSTNFTFFHHILTNNQKVVKLTKFLNTSLKSWPKNLSNEYKYAEQNPNKPIRIFIVLTIHILVSDVLKIVNNW